MSIFDFFTPAKPLPAGILRYESSPEAKKPYRMHLRLNTDGSGLLILNAATVLHLNATAAEYAYHLIKGTPAEETAKQIAKRYRVQKTQALADYRLFCERIETLVHNEDLDPVTYLGFERAAPHSANLTAPLRLDCALTYRLPPEISADSAPTKRVDRELDTAEWKSILSQAWDAGIPHVTFTGGEPTLREDLPELIAHAEELGMVSGLLTDGLKLANEHYLNTLLQTGLDHLLFLLQTNNEKSWQALDTILPADIYTTVHLTVTDENAAEISSALKRLSRLPLNALSLSSIRDLNEPLEAARQQAAEAGISLNWDLPVPYSAHNPVALETLAEHNPSGAGKVWLYIEPDGDILPAQGMADRILGNALRDDWSKIWKSR